MDSYSEGGPSTIQSLFGATKRARNVEWEKMKSVEASKVGTQPMQAKVV